MIRASAGRLVCRQCCALLLGAALLAGCGPASPATVVASGLNLPRGMAFDGASNLYVAEAGAPDPTDGNISPPINHSGRIVRISPGGQISTVLEGLPFTHYSAAGDVGPSDVALIDDTLYLLTGEGYDDELSRAVLRAAPGEPPERIASILDFVERTTTFDSTMGSETLLANPFALAAAPDGASLYVTDGASGRVYRITLDGATSLAAELPGSPPLTGAVFGPDGLLYVALFSALPLRPGNGAIWALGPNNALSIRQPDLTMPTDVAFDAAGVLYILEFSNSHDIARPYLPDSGRVLRIEPDGTRSVVLDRINYPTAMAFAPTGDLYIAVNGAFSPAGQGSVLKLTCAALGPASACPAEP